jgi:uncharacterized membrane protein YccC
VTGPWAAALAAVRAEFSNLAWRGERARHSLITGTATGLALVLALALRLDQPYWAAISAFVCSQATQANSVNRALDRVLGTVLGASAALVWYWMVAFDTASVLLLLFAAAMLAVLGNLVSRHPYAWLLGGLTTMMVVLGSLDDPRVALAVAASRCAEITLGSVVALAGANLLPVGGPAAAPAAPGWRSLLGDNWFMLNHALHTGVAIALAPIAWRVFELPDLSQMSISIGAAMGVPALTGEPQRDARLVADRMAQRVVGCLLGGAAGLLVLATPLSAMLVPWLALLTAGTAIAAQFQTGNHKVAVAGTQAVIALIITLVQGAQPAETLLPALTRLAGMLAAVALLGAVALILGPPAPRRAAP